MKRSILVLFALFCCFAAPAEIVTMEKARSVAIGFFDETSVQPVEPFSDGTKTSAENPAFYIFDNPSGGWVIVAGDDCLNPVLAYSRTGRFHTEGMPDNLIWWTDAIKAGVAYARKSGLKSGREQRTLWSLGGKGTKSSGRSIYMETATWHQNSPYNFYCPEVRESTAEDPEGKTYKSVSGCVSTAMAITMHYHRHPAHGTGVLPDYSYISSFKKQVDIKGFDISSHNYNYDSMPFDDKDVQKAGASSQQQIARLIYDVGVAIKSQYNYSTGTSAAAEDVLPAFVDNFGYDASAKLLKRSDYAPGDWIELLKNCLDKKLPVPYAGEGKSSGHMFVLAGYDERDMFYINWGWAGTDDGYYSIKDLYIDEKYSFGQEHSAFIGLKPDEGGTSENCINLLSPGISIISGIPGEDVEFKIKVNSFINRDKSDYNGSVRAAIVDCRDSLRFFAGPEVAMNIEGMDDDYSFHLEQLDSYTCTISGKLNFGDGLAFFYKTNRDNWKLVPYDREDLGLTRFGAYDACAIRLPESIVSGDVLAPSLILGQRAVKSVEWFLDNVLIEIGQTAPLMAGIHTIAAFITFDDGESESLVQEINVK